MARRFDTAKSLDQTNVMFVVITSLLFRRPVGMQEQGVLAERAGEREFLEWRPCGLRNTAALAPGNRPPAVRIFDDVFFTHAVIVRAGAIARGRVSREVGGFARRHDDLR